MANIPPDTILVFNGAGRQSFRYSNGTAFNNSTSVPIPEGADELILDTPQSGPPVLQTPSGGSVDQNADVVKPYDQVTSPGVIVTR